MGFLVLFEHTVRVGSDGAPNTLTVGERVFERMLPRADCEEGATVTERLPRISAVVKGPT